MAATCTSCGVELESRLACESCGALQAEIDGLSPFEALGLEPSAELDAGVVRKRVLRLSRLTHPDFFTGASADQQELAERASAKLNEASKQLSDTMRRIDWLVAWLGGPSEADERQMPQAFLMEVLEWNETLEEAKAAQPGSKERDALDALESQLTSERASLETDLVSALSPLPERDSSGLTDLRRSLNAVRYIDRTLGEIRGLRLADASSR